VGGSKGSAATTGVKDMKTASSNRGGRNARSSSRTGTGPRGTGRAGKGSAAHTAGVGKDVDTGEPIEKDFKESVEVAVTGVDDSAYQSGSKLCTANSGVRALKWDDRSLLHVAAGGQVLGWEMASDTLVHTITPVSQIVHESKLVLLS
jgi:hypothetical protein